MPGIQISPHSELGKELRKWEQHHTPYAIDENGDMKPGNVYRFQPFPAMLYRASVVNGKGVVTLDPPNPLLFERADAYQRAEILVDTQNKANQRIVHSDDERRRAMNEGWRESPQEALALHEEREIAIANAAAEAAFHAQRMTEQAKAEFAHAGGQTDKHVVDVAPMKKRGRPAVGKAQAVTGAGVLEH